MNQEQVLRTLREKVSPDCPQKKILVSFDEGELKNLTNVKEVIRCKVTRPLPQAKFFVKLYVLLASEETKCYYSHSVISANQIPSWITSLIAKQRNEVDGFATVLVTNDQEKVITKAIIFCE